MKKIALLAMGALFSNSLSSQQWDGATNSTDHIFRNGNVSIGIQTLYNQKLNVLGGSRFLTAGILPSVHNVSVQPNLDNSVVLGNSGKNKTDFYLTRFSEGLHIFPSTLAYTFDGYFNNMAPTFFISNYTKIGIGTYNVDCANCTDYRLFVRNGIKTEKVKVEIAASNGWADYVFAKDYKLTPLRDLESYINKNGHLPEVPTTEEAIANGIELKAMNILLLKKIEELTLYTLQQQKNIEEQSKRIETLEKKVNK
ncbi:hypothetical protein MQX03_02125 [Chryseobacterium aahli]|uniref:hypothetical protein n=1 Tax=Chryseobacterium aahli TaxID=1278643 RepID=UPI001F60F912|nr:hypothetical protein [Chryseobacterium aahli]MCI3935977.1 hypothetical protein [Chryseobacterium aahli]